MVCFIHEILLSSSLYLRIALFEEHQGLRLRSGIANAKGQGKSILNLKPKPSPVKGEG